MSDELDRPRWTDNPEGETRRVGVEVEFAGLDAESTAELVVAEFGGTVTRVSGFEYQVCDTDLGDFRVELDLRALKRLGKEVEDDDDDSFKRSTAKLLGRLAETTVPTEIVTPPVPWDQLGRVNDLIARLAEAGAEGTQESLIFAFGVHLNPDCASFEPDHLCQVMQAYACLHDWLASRHEIDLVRRLTPFIQPYPDAYEQHLLASDYAPSRSRLIDDYLEYNPSRNRALDMLPVFCFLDEARVRKVLPDEKINPRPTFHYRLPNSEVGRDRWGIATAWNGWVTVEKLAASSDLLGTIRAARLEFLDTLTLGAVSPWIKHIEAQCLPDL